MQVPLMRLECGCNSYEWGKVGSNSVAAKLASATNFQIQEDKPYAELWMGTHPSLPSKDLETGRSLLDMVQDNQALMTQKINQKYGDKLPFLFKILSINKALSIQAHPNKKLAEQLHAKDSSHYPDDNHKPEMTIAITPFSGFCGFRPLEEISHFLKHVQPLRDLVGDAAANQFIDTVSDSSSDESTKKGVLKQAFSNLMKNAVESQERLKSASESLLLHAQSDNSSFAGGGGSSPQSGQQLANLVTTLNSQFPADIGLFVLFFLNHVQLSPGEAMFLRADDIHAYLSGDIVECMASSDNVVRAGFTPKFKDVETLSSMLTYNYAPIDEQKMIPTDWMYVKFDRAAYSAGSTATLYDPPIEEFSLIKTELSGKGKATFDTIEGPSIIVCTQGQGKITVGNKTEDVKRGYVFFIGATAECILESVSDEPFLTFRAFCEIDDKATATNGVHTNGSL